MKHAPVIVVLITCIGSASLTSALPVLSTTSPGPTISAISTFPKSPAPEPTPSKEFIYRQHIADPLDKSAGHAISGSIPGIFKTQNRPFPYPRADADKVEEGPIDWQLPYALPHEEQSYVFASQEPGESVLNYAARTIEAYFGKHPEHICIKRFSSQRIRAFVRSQRVYASPGETPTAHARRMTKMYLASCKAAQVTPPVLDTDVKQFESLANVNLFFENDNGVARQSRENAWDYVQRLVQTYFVEFLGVPKAEFQRAYNANSNILNSQPQNLDDDSKVYAKRLIWTFAKVLEEIGRMDPRNADNSGIPNKVGFFFLRRQPHEDDMNWAVRVIKAFFSRRPGVYTVFYPGIFSDSSIRVAVRSIPRQDGEGLWNYGQRLIQLFRDLVIQKQVM